RMTNLAGLYGTLLEDNNLSYSMQTGYAGGGNGDNGSTGYTALNYRGGYGNANVGYSRSDGFKQLYYGVSGGGGGGAPPPPPPRPPKKKNGGGGGTPPPP
ncbi:fimbria/pilus outer membrane usher protein, partial [Klebsiella pneumoniae]